ASAKPAREALAPGILECLDNHGQYVIVSFGHDLTPSQHSKAKSILKVKTKVKLNNLRKAKSLLKVKNLPKAKISLKAKTKPKAKTKAKVLKAN
ncbi:MAG: hypothetical protein ACXWQO_04175, partial [Bdellovibrionota bacterium]